MELGVQQSKMTSLMREFCSASNSSMSHPGVNSDILFNGKSLKLKDLEQTTVISGKRSSEIERI